MKKWITITLTLLFNMIFSQQQQGKGSWYGGKHNFKKTASGEVFHESKLTAASNDYKFGTMVRVTNIENGESVLVKINDRGGFKKYNRIIDLSKAAFEAIADIRKGLITVMVTVVN